MGFLFPCIFAFTGCFSYFAISPYLFVSYLDYPITSYAYLNIPVLAAFVVGDIFQRIFIKRFSHYKMIVIALFFMVLSAISLIAFMGINQHMTLAALLPMSLFLFASGIICPCSLAKVRYEADPYKIEAAAFAPYLIYVVSGIGIYTLSSVNLFSPISPNIFFATLCVLSLLFFFIFARPDSKTSNQTNLNNAPQDKN